MRWRFFQGRGLRPLTARLAFPQSEGSKIRLFIIILIVLLGVFFYKTFKITVSSHLGKDTSLIILRGDDVSDVKMMLEPRGDLFAVKHASGIDVFSSGNIGDNNRDSLLGGDALIRMGNNLYGVDITTSHESWQTVYKRRVDQIRGPVIIGGKIPGELQSTANASYYVMMDWSKVEGDQQSLKRKEYLKIEHFNGRAMYVSTHLAGLKILRGGQRYSITPDTKVIAFSGDRIEGHGYFFKLNLQMDYYSMGLERRKGLFLKIDAVESGGKETSKQNMMVNATLQHKGYFLASNSKASRVIRVENGNVTLSVENSETVDLKGPGRIGLISVTDNKLRFKSNSDTPISVQSEADFSTLISGEEKVLDPGTTADILFQDSEYFAAEDESDEENGEYPLEILYRQIAKDFPSLRISAVDDRFGAVLNDLLNLPGFFDLHRQLFPSKRLSNFIVKLAHSTAEIRTRQFDSLSVAQKKAIVKLNRMTLEETYPGVCPKSGFNIVRVVNVKGKGALFLPLTGEAHRSYRLSSLGRTIISGEGHLLGRLLGHYIPDQTVIEGRPERALRNFTITADRGFLSAEPKLLDGKKSKNRDRKLESMISSYNRERAPVGLMVSGYVRFVDGDGKGNVREVPISSDSGWRTSKDMTRDSWREVDSDWRWHPQLQLYRDTEFSGQSWMWYPEAWHPEKMDPEAGVVRYFRLGITTPGKPVRAEMKIATNADFSVSLNGHELKSSSSLWPQVALFEFPGPSIKYNYAFPLTGNAENVLLIKVTRKMPSSCTSDVILPFKKDICLELFANLISQSDKVSTPGYINKRGRTRGERGQIVDRDGMSIPRIVVDRGNFMLPKGTQVLLDGLHPALRMKQNQASKRIYLFNSLTAGGKTVLFDDKSIRISYSKGGSICVEGEISEHYKRETKNSDRPPVIQGKTKGVCLSEDMELIKWGRDSWLQNNTFSNGLLTGDIIVIDQTTGIVHQADLSAGVYSDKAGAEGGHYLEFISGAGGDRRGFALKYGGKGASVLSRTGATKKSPYLLEDGDIIEIPDVDLRMHFEAGNGVLAKDVRDRNSWSRTYPAKTGLAPLVGVSWNGLETGLERVFDKVLSGEGYGKSRKNVRVTIDDDIQRLVQMELERGFAQKKHRYAEEIIKCESEKKINCRKRFMERFHDGAFVLLDIDTGEILASANYPAVDYDDDAISDALDFDKYNGAKSSLLNRGWQMLYSPGSTFKIVTAIAALSTIKEQESTDRDFVNPIREMVDGHMPPGYGKGVTNLKDKTLPVLCRNSAAACPEDLLIPVKLSNDRGVRGVEVDNGPFDIENELAESMNTYFGYLSLLMYKPAREKRPGYDMGQGLMGEEIIKWEYPVIHYAEQFGYNTNFRLLPKEMLNNKDLLRLLNADGSDVLHSIKSSFPHHGLDLHSVAKSGIGQADVKVTPLQQAVVSSAVAGSGEYRAPYLIKEAGGVSSKQAEAYKMNASGFERVKKGMKKVILEGTGRAAFSDSSSIIKYRVYGKTGTTQRGPDVKLMNDSWFVGFIEPNSNGANDLDIAKHRLAFACVMGDTGYGGHYAADTVERVLRRLSKYLQWGE